MNNDVKCLFAMCGHTAAGKTTLAAQISQFFKIPYISEGACKRVLVKNYSSENSLDESLRDKGYIIAIDKCINLLSTERGAVLDASFHRSKRRDWVYQSLLRNNGINLVWVYCNCPDEREVERRLKIREQTKIKTADNQADKFYIYEFIKSNFEPIDINCFSEIGTAVIEVDTSNNCIVRVNKNERFSCPSFLSELRERVIPDYFNAIKDTVSCEHQKE